MEILEFLLHSDQIFISTALLVLVVLLIGSIVVDKLKQYEDVDVNGAVTLMDDNNLIVLDVRGEKERKNGFIANDINIPFAQVKNKLNSLDNNKKVLVYCHTGSRSAHVASLLTRNDFTKVYSLKGGIQAWKKANLPIKS